MAVWHAGHSQISQVLHGGLWSFGVRVPWIYTFHKFSQWSENDLRMICSCYFMIYNIYQYFTVLVKLMLLHPIIFAMIHPFTLLLHHRFLKNFALNGVCCGPNGLLTAWSQDHPRPSKTDKTKICWVIATAFVIPGWEWSEKLVRMA